MQFARRILVATACALGLLVTVSVGRAQPIALLPNDTELIVTINFQQILKSEVVKANKTLIDLAKGKIEEQLDDKGVSKWLKKADFDLFRDLSSVTFAVPGGRNPQEGIILLEGKFNAEKIDAAVVAASKEAGGGVKVTRIANVKAYEVTPKEDKTMYVGVLDSKTIIACATKKDFAAAVARLNSAKAPAFKSAAIKKLMSTVNKKQSISMVATASLLAKLGENSPQADNPQVQQAMAILKTMEGGSLALTINKDIDLQVAVTTMDAETAQKYAGVLNLLVGVAKMKVAEKAKEDEKFKTVVDIVNTVRVTTQGPNLVIRGQVTFANLEKLLQNLPIPQN
ncbi:MAG: hypothetical protein HYX68_26820 [Planctomycetes bacterium]|nr:hypothetical protein [Planctomycetota bacterium]